jgi:hypothetical protein
MTPLRHGLSATYLAADGLPRPPQCPCGRAPASREDGLCDYCRMRRGGFKPPIGPDRCRDCGFHVPTQAHRTGCPRTGGTWDLPPDWPRRSVEQRAAVIAAKQAATS